jgi:hypothetical protein
MVSAVGGHGVHHNSNLHHNSSAGGLMLLALTPAPLHSLPLPPHHAPAAMVYTFTFALDPQLTVNNAEELASFKAELQRAVLAGLAEQWSEGAPALSDASGALHLGYVAVNSVRAAGDVVASVSVLPPEGTSAAALKQLSALPPRDLVSASSSLRPSLLSGERSTDALAAARSHATAGAGSKQLRGDAIIGVVVGCVGMMAAIVASVIVLLKRRRVTTKRPEQQQDNTLATALKGDSDDGSASSAAASSSAGGSSTSDAEAAFVSADGGPDGSKSSSAPHK